MIVVAVAGIASWVMVAARILLIPIVICSGPTVGAVLGGRQSGGRYHGFVSGALIGGVVQAVVISPVALAFSTAINILYADLLTTGSIIFMALFAVDLFAGLLVGPLVWFLYAILISRRA
jgi:hypothetical protein